VKLLETVCRTVVLRLEEEEALVSWYRADAVHEEAFPEMDGGGVCTTV
jgi:hypothetical protein